MNDVAELTLRIDSLEAKGAKADLDKLAEAGKGAAGSADVLETAFKRLMVVLGPAALAAAFVSAVKGAIELQASYVRLAEVAGTTSSMMSAMDLPARLAGTSLDTVATSVARLSKSLGEAQLGDVAKAGMFKALGIDPKDGRDAAAVMVDVAKALTGMKDQNVAAAASLSILNRGFAELRPFMKELAEQGTLVARTTDEQNAAAKRFEDELVKFNFQLEQSKIVLANELLPVLSEMLKILVDTTAATGEQGVVFQASIVIFQTLTVLGSELVFIMKELGGATGVWIAQVERLTHLDWKGFKLIGEEWDRDSAKARKDLDEFQARVMTLGKGRPALAAPVAPGGAMDMGIGLAAMMPGNAEAGVRKLMEDAKNYEARIAAAKGFADRYAEVIKLQNALAVEANKQGMLSDRALIEEVAANENRRLTVLRSSFVEQQRLSAQQGLLAKAKEAAEAIIQTDVQIVASKELAAARLATLTAQQVADYEKWRRAALDTGEQIAMSFGTVKEIEDRAYEERRLALEVFLSDQGEQYEHAARDRERLAWEHQAKLGSLEAQGELARVKFSQQNMREQAKTIFGELASITAGVAQHNRTLFEINKVAGIANAIINTYEGVSTTLKAYPWPLAGIMAAIHLAAGLAQVSAIQSATFGGGGGGGAAPSLAGATPASPVTPVAAAQAPAGPATVINLHGDTFSRSQLIELFDRINEHAVDGGKITLG